MDENERMRRVVGDLVEWFEQHGRPWPWRESRDRWVVLVSEVCLQQTQVTRGAPYVERILARFPTPRDLARAQLGELLAMWSGLGFPRRARNLWLAAQQIDADGWPDELRDLPGVGPYTAAAVRCFADEAAIVPIDVNTRRVRERLFPQGLPGPEAVPTTHDDPWTWGSALMEHGQRTCAARARCDACVVRRLCPSRGTTDVIASPRQQPYAGSMRQRRGNLLRRVSAGEVVPVDEDRDAADALVADGLAAQVVTAAGDVVLIPP